MTQFQVKFLGRALGLIMLGVAGFFVWHFGLTPSSKHEDWGTFGDYFGGVLNPLFALFGFVGIMRSLHLQQEQIASVQRDKIAEEVLEAVKDIDLRINIALGSHVGVVRARSINTADTELFVSHMVAEGLRGAKKCGDSSSYAEFIKTCRQTGSVVGVAVAEVQSLVTQLADIVRHHPSHSKDEYSPVLFYYVNKAARLIPMLEDIGGISNDTMAFYKDVRWTRQQPQVTT